MGENRAVCISILIFVLALLSVESIFAKSIGKCGVPEEAGYHGIRWGLSFEEFKMCHPLPYGDDRLDFNIGNCRSVMWPIFVSTQKPLDYSNNDIYMNAAKVSSVLDNHVTYLFSNGHFVAASVEKSFDDDMKVAIVKKMSEKGYAPVGTETGAFTAGDGNVLKMLTDSFVLKNAKAVMFVASYDKVGKAWGWNQTVVCDAAFKKNIAEKYSAVIGGEEKAALILENARKKKENESTLDQMAP